MKFKLHSPFPPAGDQAQAIEGLILGMKKGKPHQVLLGVTGSGKTYTVAQVIAQVQKPTLVISHNKTLAAQLYQEFKEFFPQNGVGFFISYYDYYQPEAYIPQTDTYIAKETDINQEIDKLRLQATSLLFSRQDALIVASVSCIYNLGSPFEYGRYAIDLKKGQKIDQKKFLYRLVSLHYSRSKMELNRGNFRLRGETIEIFPAYSDEILRLSITNGRLKKLTLRSLFAGDQVEVEGFLIYPAKHYLTNPDILNEAFRQIKEDLKIRTSELKKQKKMLEAHRLEQRVKYDLEMIRETGYVNGIENYSRYFDGRAPGEPPWALIDYFKHLYGDDFLVVIDESHMTVPQLRGMYRGDRSRKTFLIEFGFRLSSCLDNRPLKFNEFAQRVPQTIYVSATPNDWEIQKADSKVVEQLIRPTGLVDPEVMVRPEKGQIQDLVKEILKRKKQGERVLVTTLTKKMAEELAFWLKDLKNTKAPITVHYLHADVATLERSDILADLRRGKYDVIVGVNLLREGLDLPEVSLVAILDANKQGFLRSKTSLIQTMGRASRNVSGQVILYADQSSWAMKEAIKEVNRRRKTQLAYNREHGITPRTIQKPIRDRIVKKSAKKQKKSKFSEIDLEALTPGDAKKLIPKLRREMRQAAAALEFEKAAEIRDLIEKISRG
ncbi:MAG TPA: excinuclease ABC subunit UvrB [Nevskiaceae bacterium]|nr:excinuclease ABC subunit UvrB [Nevskiaceae bacterium]